MATAKKDSFDGFTGKFKDHVVYLLNGKLVKRPIGVITVPGTELQLIYRKQTGITNQFIKPTREFMKIGFKAEAKLAQKNPESLISSYTRLNAIKGTYPNQEIDFTKARFSQGNMPDTPGTQIKLTDEGLEFTWDKKLIRGKFRYDDQAMLLAYFPALKTAEYSISGGARSTGAATLPLLRNESPTVMEVYISFISADREKVSNSVYMGQLILPGHDFNLQA